MKHKILIALAASLFIIGCGKKAGEAVADALADTLLPADVTPCDAPAADTPADATLLCADATPAE
jgi:hypothetical protein